MKQSYVMKQLAAAPSEGLAFFDSLLENAPIGFALIDRSLRYVRINEVLAGLNRRSIADHLGKTIKEVIPHLADKVEASVRHVFATQKPIINEELRGKSLTLPLRKGQWLVSYYPIPKDGPPELVGVCITEISERMANEEQLHALACELARSNRQLEQFAYLVANDLHEPLRMVSIFLGLLAKRRQGQWDPSSEEYLKFALDGAKRMKVLIEKLLEFSRVDMHQAGSHLVSAASLVDEALIDLRLLVQSTGAKITVGTLPMVMGDRVQMLQVFTHLISNALKFNRRSPEIGIFSEPDRPGYWRFCVKDNGIGILKEHQDRIFLIFQKLNPAQEFPGEGMGLAICRKIIERHGGKLWLESTEGEGSTFFFTLRGK